MPAYIENNLKRVGIILKIGNKNDGSDLKGGIDFLVINSILSSFITRKF